MIARGYPKDFAERTFKQIEGFGSYSFPESHAASFAKIAYASCWVNTQKALGINHRKNIDITELKGAAAPFFLRKRSLALSRANRLIPIHFKKRPARRVRKAMCKGRARR